MNITNQKGVTLVELLVAGALGILLLAVVIAIYLSSKTTFVATQGVARSQEATRFAVGFMKRDIRLSGFRDCAGSASSRLHLDDTVGTFPPSLENAVFGWEYEGTDTGDSYTLAYDEVDAPFTQAEVADARTANTDVATKWTGNFIEGVPGVDRVLNLAPLISGFDPLKGSDILAVTIAEPSPLILQTQTNQRETFINVVDDAGNTIPSGIDQGRVLQVGDCSAIDIFQNLAVDTDDFISVVPSGGTAAPGNRLNADFQWQKKWGPDAIVYEANTKVYFVGTGAGGKPSLFVYSTNCGLAAGCGANQAELVEGVENMQVLYGEDSDQDGTIDQYLSADSVADFRGVRAVKLSFLVRSIESGTDVSQVLNYTLNGETTIVPPVDDRNQRFVNSTTIYLHNRGL